MASSSNWLSGVNVVLVMAYGSLVRFPDPIPAVACDLVEPLPVSSSLSAFCTHSPALFLGFDPYPGSTWGRKSPTCAAPPLAKSPPSEP